MGVRGLLSHCLRNQEHCCDVVDLIVLARERNGIEILVDYYSFQFYMNEKFLQSLMALSGNKFLPLIGGEFQSLDVYISEFINNLKSLDVHLVMFIDGAKGSSRIQMQHKLETWKQRRLRDFLQQRNNMEVFSWHRKIEDLSFRDYLFPVLCSCQFKNTLKRCGCEMVRVNGEADYIIARNLIHRPRAVAVFSNDSDFCLFKDSHFIAQELFDLENDLQLGQPNLPRKPTQLICGIISSAKLISFLQFESHDLLVEVSILAGNDFTGPHLSDEVKTSLNLHGHSSFHKVLQLIRSHKKVECIPAFRKAARKSRELQEAIEHSRRFYNLDSSPEETTMLSNLGQFIANGIEQGRLPAVLLGMHNGCYWHKTFLEDVETHPSSDMALRDLRRHIYRMVLDPDQRAVTEYGRGPRDELRVEQVQPSRSQYLRPVNEINQDKVFFKLGTIRRILTHDEPHFKADFFKKYGWRNGLICHSLRYFLRLNTGRNLDVSLEEFLVMTAMTLGCNMLDLGFYQSLCILPSVRCITLMNWMQNIYNYTYNGLGKIFQMTHSFSEPRLMFSGAIFSALYMLCFHHGELSHSGFPRHLAQRIHREFEMILREKRHMIKSIVEGIHYYDPR